MYICSGTSVIFYGQRRCQYTRVNNTASSKWNFSHLYTTSSLANGQVVDVVVTNASGCTLISAIITNTVISFTGSANIKY
jgi:hypothetical protein